MEIIIPALRELILVAMILLLTWVVMRFKKAFHRKMLERRTHGKHAFDPLSLEILEKFFTVIVFFISAMLILQVFGVDIVPLLTFSGIGAAAVGFAGRDVVANFFGGLMIYMSRPFAICDYIEVPDKKIAGTVEEIGWYFTSIRSVQKTPLYIPNSIFSTGLVINHSRTTHRRIEEKIRIKTNEPDKARSLVEKIRKIVQEEPLVDRRQPIEVFLQTISPWGLEIDVKVYLSTTQNEKFLEIKEKLLLKIYEAQCSELGS